MSKPLVLYHGGGCRDGWTSAWLMFHALRSYCDLKAVNYSDGEVPDVTGRRVYIVDFSYPRDVLRKMIRDAESLLVIDHHKTAAAELDYMKCCIFDMDHSGAFLTWQYLQQESLIHQAAFNSKWRGCGEHWDSPPQLVRYVEDRDLWKFELPHSRAINEYIRSFPMDVETFDQLAQTDLLTKVECGERLVEAISQMVDIHVSHAQPVRIGDHEVPGVNATVYQSEVAGRLAEGQRFAAVWFDIAGGKRVYSLRSEPNGLDVSEIAKQFGGGGHKHAAGFTIESQQVALG